MKWLFDEPRDVAVFTTTYVIHEQHTITYVSHDDEDGAWQFHSDDESDIEDALIVSLEEIVGRDPSIQELNDLPEGWYAVREDEHAAWERYKK